MGAKTSPSSTSVRLRNRNFRSRSTSDSNGHVLYSNQAIPTGSEGEGGDPGGSIFVGFVSQSPRIARILVNGFDDDGVYPDSDIGYDTYRVGSVGHPMD